MKVIKLRVVLVLVAALPVLVAAQTATDVPDGRRPRADEATVALYFDPAGGMTVDEAVARALASNGELLAMRKEVEAARALVKQASVRPNPRLDVSGAKAVNMSDNQIMVEGMLPLELGGRRASRVRVAGREVEMREALLADRERNVAAQVREKFGEALAEVLKLGVTEDLLLNSQKGYRLVVARVLEGRTAPLEQNQVLVEVNRLRSVREMERGRTEVALLELRNLIGTEPSEPLKLRGDFDGLIDPLPATADATARALASRADLLAARAAEALAAARVEEARASGRADAEVRAGYQRMRTGFTLNGIDDTGRPAPIEDTFHSITFGVSVTLPLRGKNAGALEATAAELEAAKRRREFLELTVRREVAAGYAAYEAAARASEIYRVGVRGQAGQNLSVIRKTYELGSKTLLDYIAEQRRYIELENDYIASILETYLARVRIARVSASPELMGK
ncbi:MAG: outer membrane protein heavy metal efflux system [Acidobacteriota bacterium]|jgi:cobalt-zinc-cadmium efflux system outer membrane protein|nr:outer membrane protein heavy metal efflux system [Acidobacteriota bacterium]